MGPTTSKRRWSAPALLIACLVLAMEFSLACSESFLAWPSDPLAMPEARHGRMLLSSRVGSVGVAIFVILFFMGLCLTVCLIGSRSKFPWLFYSTSTIVFGIVFGILAGSPKGPAPVKPDSGYDQTIVPMTVIMVFMCLGIVVSWMGMLICQGIPQHYAKPLSHHVDVLRGGNGVIRNLG